MQEQTFLIAANRLFLEGQLRLKHTTKVSRSQLNQSKPLNFININRNPSRLS